MRNPLNSAPWRIMVVVTQEDIDNGDTSSQGNYNCPLSRAWRRAVRAIAQPGVRGISVGLHRATVHDGEHLIYYSLPPSAVKFVRNVLRGNLTKLKPIRFEAVRYDYCRCVYSPDLV